MTADGLFFNRPLSAIARPHGTIYLRPLQVSPDYYFAKGVPGPGIKATGPYLIWEIGKPPDFVLEMASPAKAREDLTTKRKLYEKIGITEY